MPTDSVLVMSGSDAYHENGESSRKATRLSVRTSAGSRRKVNPEASHERISALDGRSAEKRLMKRFREELTAHVGGNPSPTQRAIIEQAASLALRMRLMDQRFLTNAGMSQHDSRTYLAWSNTYTLTLRQLGLKGAASAPKSLADHIGARGR
jgi:hypothetical protein